MILRARIKVLLMLGSTMLLTALAFSGAARATISAQTGPIVIEYGDDGFSIRNLTVTVGTTVTWRNNTDKTLNLRGNASQHMVALPLIAGGGAGANGSPTADNEASNSAPASPASGFDVIIEPGGEYSRQLNVIGLFQFMDLIDHNARGVIAVAPLTRIYAGDDGSALYLQTVGNTVYGFGEHPNVPYAYVLHGTIQNLHIGGTFWDIPKGERMNDGDVVISVSPDGSLLELESDSTAIGTDSWQEVAPGSFLWPGAQPAGFQTIVADDLPSDVTGAFEASDGSRYYIREIVSENRIVLVGEMLAQPDVRPDWVNVFVGERDSQAQVVGSFADVPKGSREADGTFGVNIDDDRTLDIALHTISLTYNVEPDYAVDWDLFEDGIHDYLESNVAGYSFAIGKDQSLVGWGAGGHRLLSQDGGPKPFTIYTQSQAFSTSKTVTAVALANALYEKNIPIDDPIGGYLPECWDIEPDVLNITFLQLLKHTSGLGQPNEATPYLTLRKLIEDGVVGDPVKKYNNQVYSFMRYLIPYVLDGAYADFVFDAFNCGENEISGNTINNAMSIIFGDYLFAMLDEVGVEATFFHDDYPTDPALVNVAYLYNRSFLQFDGIPPNEDGWNKAGAGYLAISANEFRQFLNALEEGLIIPKWLVEYMYAEELGFDGKAEGVLGYYHRKNGANSGDCGGGGRAELMIFPSGIHAYVMTNSKADGVPANWYYDYNHNIDEIDVISWGLTGGRPIAGDFDSDGSEDDVAMFQSSSQNWYYDIDHDGVGPLGTYDEMEPDWGRDEDIPLAGDFDGDGEADDIAVFRPSNQNWYFDYDRDGVGDLGNYDEILLDWGTEEDIPLAGNFDGQNDAYDIAVFHPPSQNWYFDFDHDGVGPLGGHDEELLDWGREEDLPLAGDFDRDGYANDIAVFRPSSQEWYYDYGHDGVGPESDNYDEKVVGWGSVNDLPVSGDFDRDGYVDDIAVFRPLTGQWFYDYNHDGVGKTDATVYNWGISGDFPIVGDFDGDDLVDDVAVFRSSSRDWYFDLNHDGTTFSSYTIYDWGATGDIPLAGDFDEDGLVDDIAVFRPSDQNWLFDHDRDGVGDLGNFDEMMVNWGSRNDLPVVGDFDRNGIVNDVAVYRPSEQRWFFDHYHDGVTDGASIEFGADCSVPIVGDFNRDGYIDDIAVFSPTKGRWYYDYYHNGTLNKVVSSWGTGSAIPLAGDFDKDGYIDDTGIFGTGGLDLNIVLRKAFDNALK